MANFLLYWMSLSATDDAHEGLSRWTILSIAILVGSVLAVIFGLVLSALYIVRTIKRNKNKK